MKNGPKMLSFSALPLYYILFIFLISAIVIGIAGIRLTSVAEEIAVQTGWGQAVVGAVFVGVSTSLSGTILSFYSASQNYPSLSISNGIGGIAAQTAFLAVADLTYRKVNLEHAAASLENLAQGALLLILLSLPLIAMASSEWTYLNIHPVSFFLVAAYFVGLKIIRTIKSDPMWKPKVTKETQIEEEKENTNIKKLRTRIYIFALMAFLLFSAGVFLAEAAIELSKRTNLSESVVGGFFTSVTTSLPELVTTLAAVRRGALNLAVGDIIGGNCFDVLFLAGSDIFYSNGSIYHKIQNDHIILIGMSILMTGILILGMLRREKSGFAGIGFESSLILGLYVLLTFMIFN